MSEEVLNDKSKIENLLNLISKSNSVIYIRIGLNEYSGIIKELGYNEFSFFTKFKIAELSPFVRINFNYLNKYYFFDTKFIRREKNLIYLQIPEIIYRHYKRKSTRYKADKFNIFADIKIINIADSPTISFIKNNVKPSHIKSEIYKELQKDVPNANLILNLILREIKEFSIVDNVKIIMPLKEENIIAKILKIWKKPLLIQNAQTREEYLKNPYPNEVITFLDYIKFLRKNNTPEEKINEFIDKHISHYKKEDIFSILYTPIFVSNIMPGYIYAYNISGSKKIIRLNEINYFKDVAEIIHEALLKRRLNSLTSEELNVKVIDISTNGIGLEVVDPLLSSAFTEGMKLRCKIFFNRKKEYVIFTGVIRSMRKQKNSVYIGVEIREMLEKNRMVLYNFIENYLKPHQMASPT